MKKYLLLIILVLSVVSCRTGSATEVELTEEIALQQIMQLQRKFVIADKRGETKEYEKYLLDDYSISLPDGSTLTKKEFLEAYKKGEIRFSSVEIEDLDIKLLDNSALVTGKFIVEGKLGSTDLKGKFLGAGVFLRRGEEWFFAYEHLGPKIPDTK
ncbi:MAG: nuclear transport factor 2 family protein [Pyrinomonadaceae bacterium]